MAETSSSHDLSPARKPGAKAAAPASGPTAPDETALSGILVDWRDDRGFGFVRPEGGGRDYFVHISAFGKGLSRRPQTGDTLRFQAKAGERAGGQRRVAAARIEGVRYEGPKDKPSRLESILEKVLFALPVLFSCYLIWRSANPIPLVSYIFMSALTVVYYATDKKWALSNHWRIPEYYLHGFELMGGWPGALIAQNRFRHKLKKPSYRRIYWSIVAIHGLLWAVYFYRDLGASVFR